MHICTLYDIVMKQDGASILMEYLEGEKPCGALRKDALPVQRTLKIASTCGRSGKNAPPGVVHDLSQQHHADEPRPKLWISVCEACSSSTVAAPDRYYRVCESDRRSGTRRISAT